MGLTRPSLFQEYPRWQDLGKKETGVLGAVEPRYYFVHLNPLSQVVDRELLAEILQNVAEIPERLFELVAERAEGNPFYMEEMVKMLIDDGVIVPDAAGWRVEMNQLDEGHIPGTLTGVLQARLDRLAADERVTLQRASVVGRVFWDTAVQQLGDGLGQLQLNPLQRREFIYKQSETAFADTEQFLFKHDLLRDVTYQTVLKKARQFYHGQVADWLVAVAEANGRVEEYTAVIAEHYQLANQLDQAAHWYSLAGQNAAARYAHAEAIHYLSLALDFTAKDDAAMRYSLLLTLEDVYAGEGDREAQRASFAQLTVLAEELGVTEQATVALRQANFAYIINEPDKAIAHAEAALKWGQYSHETRVLAEAYRVKGGSLDLKGQYEQAQERLRKSLHLAEVMGDLKLVASCWYFLGIQAVRQGDFVASSEYLRTALAINRDIGNRQGEATCLTGLGMVSSIQRDYVRTKELLEQVVILSREIGYRWQEGSALHNLGELSFRQGNYAAAKQHLQLSLFIFEEIEYQAGTSVALGNLGRIARNEELFDAVQTYSEQALAISRKIGDRSSEGLFLNELGILSLVQGNGHVAETYYQQALALRQGINESHYLVEDWAGLAKVSLALGNQEAAQQFVQQILDYLKINPLLNRAENPILTFRFIWEVLVALEQIAEANEVLGLAARVMQDYLDKSSDPAMQELYLRQPHHRVLWAGWQENR